MKKDKNYDRLSFESNENLRLNLNESSHIRNEKNEELKRIESKNVVTNEYGERPIMQ